MNIKHSIFLIDSEANDRGQQKGGSNTMPKPKAAATGGPAISMPSAHRGRSTKANHVIIFILI